MKNKLGTGIFFLIAGALLAFGSQLLFPVCPAGKAIMKCFWTAKAELGVGALIMLGGLFILISSSAEVRKGISFMLTGAALLSILLPSTLIGGCMKPEMKCNSVSFPAIYVIAGITFLTALINAFYLHKNTQKG